MPVKSLFWSAGVPLWVAGATGSVIQSSDFLFFYQDYNVHKLQTFIIVPLWVAGATGSVSVCA